MSEHGGSNTEAPVLIQDRDPAARQRANTLGTFRLMRDLARDALLSPIPSASLTKKMRQIKATAEDALKELR